MYKKHYPPNLDDDVWRLEKIGKDGAYHKRLCELNINTVKDFLIKYSIGPTKLREVKNMFFLCIVVVLITLVLNILFVHY